MFSIVFTIIFILTKVGKTSIISKKQEVMDGYNSCT